MEPSLDEQYKAAWKKVLEADAAAYAAQYELFSICGDSIIEIVRAGLHDPSERSTAFRIAGLLKEEQRKALLPDLVSSSLRAKLCPDHHKCAESDHVFAQTVGTRPNGSVHRTHPEVG